MRGMSDLSPVMALRRKAVWGPKRRMAAVVAAILTLGSNAFAGEADGVGGGHGRSGRSFTTSTAGHPNSYATDYRLDNELSRRARKNSVGGRTSVIVEFKDGERLPAHLRRYLKRNGKLNIINGETLELPDRLLNELAQHP